MYDVLLALHILAAGIWFGGGLMVQVFAALAARSQDPVRQQGFANDNEFVGGKVFAPASGLTLVFGISLVLVSDTWEFTDAWIIIGIALWVASMLLGAVFISGESRRLKEAAQTHGPQSPEAAQRVARLTTLARADLALMVIAVFDMAIKPGI